MDLACITVRMENSITPLHSQSKWWRKHWLAYIDLWLIGRLAAGDKTDQYIIPLMMQYLDKIGAEHIE